MWLTKAVNHASSLKDSSVCIQISTSLPGVRPWLSHSTLMNLFKGSLKEKLGHISQGSKVLAVPAGGPEWDSQHLSEIQTSLGRQRQENFSGLMDTFSS